MYDSISPFAFFYISRKKNADRSAKESIGAPYGRYVAHSHKIIETKIINWYNKQAAKDYKVRTIIDA